MMKTLHILKGERIGKMLLFSAVACMLAGGADAQQRIKPTTTGKVEKAAKPQLFKSEPTGGFSAGRTAIPTGTMRSGKSATPRTTAATKVDIATSGNIYGSLLSEGTLLDYNGAVDVLGYTNRKSIGVAGNSGYIQTHVSYDKGATWDTSLVVTQNDSLPNRYPNGVIFNPSGNTVANQAYTVVAGPMIDVAASAWNGGTFASLRLDNQNGSVLNIYNDPTNTQPQWMPRIGMCAGTNGNVYVLGVDYDFNSTATVIPFNGAIVNRGVWNATNNNFDWDRTRIYHPFSLDPADGSQNVSSLGQMAFSKDGQTGYVVYIGRDSANDPLSPMPIIYRSTDAGATWSLYFAGDLTPVYDSIFDPSLNGVVRPFFVLRNGFDLTVDANNKLHIVCEVANAYSNDPDSLNFLNYYNALFDTYEDASGNWQALFVGNLLTEPDQITTTGGTNTLGWAVDFDARVQVTRSEDGTKLAYMWMDTDTLFGTLNLYPDLKGSAADFANQLTTDIINFTAGTPYDANNYFMYASREGWSNAGEFFVPVVTSRPLNSGGLDTNPWMHEWVGGISFLDTDFVFPLQSVSELPNNTNTIALYPNPAAQSSNVVIDLKYRADVSVNVLNTMGQVVKSFDFGSAPAGSNKFQLDLSGISTGLYVIQMSIGSETATRSLSVQN